MAQAVRCPPVTMKILAQFQTIPCRIWGGQSSTGISFSPSTSVFPRWSVRFHKCSTLIHLSSMLHNLCNWQYQLITPLKTVWQWKFSSSWFPRLGTEKTSSPQYFWDTLNMKTISSHIITDSMHSPNTERSHTCLSIHHALFTQQLQAFSSHLYWK